jgi:hypothetical protein
MDNTVHRYLNALLSDPTLLEGDGGSQARRRPHSPRWAWHQPDPDGSGAECAEFGCDDPELDAECAEFGCFDPDPDPEAA